MEISYCVKNILFASLLPPLNVKWDMGMGGKNMKPSNDENSNMFR